MRYLLGLFLTVLSGLAIPALAADLSRQDPQGGYSLWGIGRTGVMCYMAPCPWRGIFPISEDGEWGFPLSRHDQPDPNITSADPAVGSAIAAAYSQDNCLIVEGRPVGAMLDVARIVGEC